MREAGFREIKQEIGSAASQTRLPNTVSNHLHLCMAATTISWLYAAQRTIEGEAASDPAWPQLGRAPLFAFPGDPYA